nr:DUF4296 domain-containing protein [uncultured Allomuricauda sp.]
MRNTVTFLLALVLFVSCAEKVIEEPENLIPKEKMAEILHDLAIMNAAKSSARNKFDESGIDIMDFIYKKYGIDSVQFAESDLYYASVPLEYQSIYESVEAKVKRQKDTLEARGKRRNDSIREANLRKKDSVAGARGEEKIEAPTSPQ